MEFQTSLFESIYEESKKYRNRNKLLDNDFNEKWECLGHKTAIFKNFEKEVEKANTSKTKLVLGEVAKVQDLDHYIAVVYGGINGHGLWKDYFKDLNKLTANYDGEIWLVDIKNDCADDCFTARFAFIPKSKKS